jgi:hypothetical protein
MLTRTRVLVVSIGLIAIFSYGVRLLSADGHDLDSKFPLFATWVRNEAKSSFNRFNRGNPPQPRKADAPPRLNQKWAMELENGGVRQKHYDTADSTDARVSVYYKFDGKEWKDPHGPQVAGEQVVPWLINPDTQIRHVYTKEKTTEWSLYVVSEDGKTFTVTAWDEDRPWARNIQVFDKVR